MSTIGDLLRSTAGLVDEREEQLEDLRSRPVMVPNLGNLERMQEELRHERETNDCLRKVLDSEHRAGESLQAQLAQATAAQQDLEEKLTRAMTERDRLASELPGLQQALVGAKARLEVQDEQIFALKGTGSEVREKLRAMAELAEQKRQLELRVAEQKKCMNETTVVLDKLRAAYGARQDESFEAFVARLHSAHAKLLLLSESAMALHDMLAKVYWPTGSEPMEMSNAIQRLADVAKIAKGE